MAIPHASAGLPEDLLSGDMPSEAQTRALVKNDSFEAIRMAIPRGHEVCRHHQVEGPITVQCLTGEIAFTSNGNTRSVRAGHWLFLPGGVPHSITAVEDSLVLLTMMFR
jgi:quercetin dioxygenase-like cupin family protein